MLDELVAALPAHPAPVLDAGCGTGRMLTHLAERGVAPLTGVDLSPGMLAHARRGHPGTPLAAADLRALPHATASLRGVLCWYAIIHSTPAEVATIAGELARVLVTDGVLLLGFQAGRGERVVDGTAYRQQTTLHGVLHEPDEVAGLLAERGFAVLATARRAAVGGERHDHGFVLARRR
ncbi:class I SAM-dependent DNA methyltransferase [Pimelobacter simplex]|uniref:class I SAM-dependent DNA methyltransferase n=1 Tax=Nocardioides simplex TaxID=2045 RepID=UPI00210031F8|nr:class I SAM-dependent methyltransferase [Pimelobacter simplex]